MIAGSVNAYREAIIDLAIRGPVGQALEAEAVIDTGFNGSLSFTFRSHCSAWPRLVPAWPCYLGRWQRKHF